ncbi:MAG: glycosyltransferase family 4 protein [Solirubrobacteraceae bacterium]
MSELRVLVLIDHLALGGAEMLLTQFARAAPRAGIALSVATLAERDGNPAAEGLRAAGTAAVNLEVPGRPGVRTIQRVRRHIAAVSPDLVHTHLGTSDWVGPLAARPLGVPVVSTVHQASWGTDLETFVKRSIVRLGTRRVIAVSEEARRHYAARAWGSARQLITIRNGIDVHSEPGAGREVRCEFGWGPDHQVVGMVSALRPEKAHDVAIEAVRRCAEQHPDLRLLIVGDGPSARAIATDATRLGDRAALAGARSDVMRCMDAFDICLHPSRADAFPTTLIEAMAASLPILATRVGGIPEIVDDGVSGILVEAPPSPERISARLVHLLGDAPMRRRLAAAGRRAYEERFTAGPWICRTRALYDEVLAGGARTEDSGRPAWPWGASR